MSVEKQCKGSVRFKADNATDEDGNDAPPRISNVYLLRDGDNDMPENLTVRIDMED